MSTAEPRRCIRCNAEVTDGKMFYREQQGDFCIGPYCAECFGAKPVEFLDDVVSAMPPNEVLDATLIVGGQEESDTAQRLATATALLRELAQQDGYASSPATEDEPDGFDWCIFCKEAWGGHKPDCLITRAEAFVKEAGA